MILTSKWSNPLKRLLALLAVLALAAAACGGSTDDTSSADKFEGVSDAIDDGGYDSDAGGESGDVTTDASGAPPTTIAPGEAAAPESDGSGAAPVGELTPADLGRSIIFTGYVELEVENVATSGAEAVDAIASIGGFVFGQNTTGGAEPRSEITFKVRPQDFDKALALLGGVGQVRSQTVSASDVTERVVDLSGRISVAELGVERLRLALEDTSDLSEFAEVERLLLARESDLEVMKGQLKTLQDQVDLATITLVLVQDRVQNNIDLSVTTYESHDGGASCTGSTTFSFTEETEYTLCFEMINTGDQTLQNITLTDHVLGINADTQLIEVFGSLSEPLHSGQSVVVAYEAKAERSLRPRTRAVANPTSGIEGDPPLPAVSTEYSYSIDVSTINRPPGFSDGFESGAAIVAGLWVAVQVIAGFLLPLLILLPFLWLAWKGYGLLRSRQEARLLARAEKARSQIPAPSTQPDEAVPSEEAIRSEGQDETKDEGAENEAEDPD